MNYIEEQLYSILKQLGKTDEIVVSDDGSKDGTAERLSEISRKEPRIKYIPGPCKGIIKNFENAISHCQGDYIFLSDQDDFWLNQKISFVMRCFKQGADLVLHDAIITDKDLKRISPSFFELNSSRKGYFDNLIKNSYMGCCMAFRTSVKPLILPFPNRIAMHDQWIGLVAERFCDVRFLKKPLIYYRRHEDNVTVLKRSPVPIMAARRLRMYHETQKRFRKLKKRYQG